jgi:2-C-methyl-D-erythritol 2,4-cyclodiphosphate synthase
MTRVGFGWDVHPFAPAGAGRSLVLGGIAVPSERGLGGHSDADVLTHAVADALLGALALGDLGQHFPDSDPRYRGISSLSLLADVVGRVRAAGGRPVNVDATVVAEGPRLAAHLDAMRKRLAETLELAVDRVSVKVKRAERLGALGRAEGIAAMAVALVEVEG